MDIGSNRDNMVGMAGNRSSVETVVKKMLCSENYVFDFFAKKCRPIYCSPGRVFVDGVCKPEEEHVTLTQSSSPSTTTTIMKTSKVPINTTIANKLAATEQRIDDNLNEINAFSMVASLGDSVTRAMEPVAPSVGGPPIDCPLLRLNASEYLMLDNRSVLIMALDEVYLPHQYLFDDGALLICSPYLNQTYQVSHNVTRTVVTFKFALAIHFIVYIMLPPLRNIPGKCLLSLVASLFTAQLLFLAGSAGTELPEVCMSLAVAKHYAFLAAFFWMNVMAADICRTFSSSRFMLPADDRSSRFVFYSLYAWLTPAAIVGGSLALDLLDVNATADFRPHYGDGLCWITRRWALLVMFALPVALLLAVNTVLFCVTVKNLCLISREAKRARGNERGQFVLYVKLSTIMGLTWVIGFVASLADMPVLWYVFDVLNTLQGAFVCFAFVCTKKVFRLLHERGRTSRAGHHQQRPQRRYQSSSSSGNSGLTRPTYLSEGEAFIITQETSI
ncbi:hypothetical protein LSAT2_025896 [Lamellibrachia satsuma]|nr:hypothetical protein LSAT2_025896 [Lamellibrachia satsuma]